ncbi:SEC-C metal-binding domain-containing protein [Aquibium sp. ELW1220]|uniref:YecA family protein n=1 Tax=Aquibium sp. ELW1220 TaxID=2976766 RepID=UPI0025AFBD0F|nr:SEC-C metal-binding domain-containing protein [Aquibium sp. ELW1220]
MTFDDIIRDFAESDTVPEKAINAALAEPEGFVDAAIALMDRVSVADASSHEHDALCVLAHVLAEIGDRRAFLPLLRLVAHRPGEDPFGDALTLTIPVVLISLMGENATALEGPMLDTEVDQFARHACFRAWTHAVVTGAIDRAHAQAFLAAYLEQTRLPRHDFGLSSWADAATTLRFGDLKDVARRHLPVRVPGKPAWLQPDPTFQDFEAMLAKAEENPDAAEGEATLKPFASTIAELSTWHGYSEEFRQRRADIERRKIQDLMEGGRREAQTVQENPYRHVGRNDPCPCGSGKKYKKCCLG